MCLIEQGCPPIALLNGDIDWLYENIKESEVKTMSVINLVTIKNEYCNFCKNASVGFFA